jgi:hypothetical protein
MIKQLVRESAVLVLDQKFVRWMPIMAVLWGNGGMMLAVALISPTCGCCDIGYPRLASIFLPRLFYGIFHNSSSSTTSPVHPSTRYTQSVSTLMQPCRLGAGTLLLHRLATSGKMCEILVLSGTKVPEAPFSPLRPGPSTKQNGAMMISIATLRQPERRKFGHGIDDLQRSPHTRR